MALELGTGTTIAFDTGFFAEIVSIDWSGITREAIDSSHFGTSAWRTFQPADLVDPGELQVEIHFDPDDTPAHGGAAETCTITWPDTTTWAASAFMTNFEITGEFEGKLTATATLKFSGAITVT